MYQTPVVTAAPGEGAQVSLPTQPIDMGDQEKQKLERKRERNRAAASKCRHRKMERISQLEEHVRELTNKNQGLKAEREELNRQARFKFDITIFLI